MTLHSLSSARARESEGSPTVRSQEEIDGLKARRMGRRRKRLERKKLNAEKKKKPLKVTETQRLSRLAATAD